MGCRGRPGSRPESRAADGSIELQPRGEPSSQAGKASTAGPATGRAPRPPPCAPHPLPGPRTQPAAAVRSRRSRLGEAGPTLHPGPRASDFSGGLGGAARPPLAGCRAARAWRDVPRRQAARGHGPAGLRRAEEQNRGPPFAPALSRARRSRGGCSGCSLGDAAVLRPSLPLLSVTSRCSGHWGRAWPSGREGCGVP